MFYTTQQLVLIACTFYRWLGEGEPVRIQSWTVKLKTVILAYQGWSWADGAKSWAAWFWQNRTVQSRDHKYKHFIMIHNGNLLYVKHIYKIKCSFLLYYYQFLNTHIRTDKFRKFRLSYNLEILPNVRKENFFILLVIIILQYFFLYKNRTKYFYILNGSFINLID